MDYLPLWIMIGFLVLIAVIWILLGAFLWPGMSRETVESFEALQSMKRRRISSRRGNPLEAFVFFLYVMALASVSINKKVFKKKWEREAAEQEAWIEENKAAESWKCLTCGRVNHGFQELCSCGQHRDDFANDRRKGKKKRSDGGR